MEILIVIAGAVLVCGWLLGRSRCRIGHELQQLDNQDAHAELAESDFHSYRALKKGVVKNLNDFVCPSCGSHPMSGRGLIVKYGKVHLYRQETYTGWFGGTKHKDVRYKTVWRIHEIGLKPGEEGSLLSAGVNPGTLECKSKGCGWKEQAPVLPRRSISEALGIQWYSLNDVLRGKPWK